MKKLIIKSLPVIFLITLNYFFIIKPLFINKLLLKSNHAYTVGKVIKKVVVVEGDADFIIFFYVNDVKYEARIGDIPNRSIHIGDCYKVQYYKKNPDICKVLSRDRCRN